MMSVLFNHCSLAVRGHRHARHGPRAAAWHIVAGLLSAVALLGLGACANGLPTADELARQDATSRAEQLVRIADSTRQSGDLGSAATLYQRAARTKPDWPVPLLRLGETFVAMDRAKEARSAFEHAAEIAPETIEPRLALGRLFLSQGRPSFALEQFEEAIEIDDEDGRAYAGAGVALDVLGRHEDARTMYRTGIDEDSDTASLYNNLALSLALTGQYDEAATLLGERIGDGQNDARTRQNLALVYGLKGDEDAAERLARQDLPESAVRNNLAFYKRLRNMTQEARAAAIFEAGRIPPTQ